jgi:hypothetical protein
MSNETRHPHDITMMLGEHYGDPALEVSTLLFLKIFRRLLTVFYQNFIPNLKDYALCKVLDLEHDADEINFTESQRASITFVKNKIYQHKVLRVNYTTYDMRREQDSLNPRTHANIMVLSQEDDMNAHPYWYARIIGIYHTFVRHESSPDPILIEFPSANLGPASADCSRLQQTTVVPVVACSACSACSACREGILAVQ